MKTISCALLLSLMCSLAASAAELPTDEAGAVAYLTAKGVMITKSKEGHPHRLMSTGQEGLSAEEYQLIGLLSHLEQMGLNAAPLKDDQWGFLKQMPNLKSLSIWHGHKFATLEPFSSLTVESLTIGGCMGLRDLNKDDADKLRNAVATLHDLPKLKKVNLYHSPLVPDDSHLAHLVAQCPKLEDLRLDVKAPRGSETTISPAGLESLHKLPLTVLNLENADEFTADHFAAIAGVKSLKSLLIDARRGTPPTAGLAAFKKLRPDVEVAVAGPGDADPPRATKR